ncbi:linear primary-alkylsulfatase-like [Saccostrea echinata]|uniref:linear primary-alkylsulfatase-like n=1 Tax=Saccostrea echinata TaxID=191078 RepID=UPI002A808ADC|nr:linear primary-alkylsulfatase-like [Saccostrea echinata]
MSALQFVFVVVVAAFAAFLGYQVRLSTIKPDMTSRIIRDMSPDQELVKHSKEFQKKEIKKVMDNIYMGIGYALGNAIMVIAPDGLIIVDVTESSLAAKEILTEFRKITKKPIKAIIYTHHHTDHIGGVGGFIEDPSNLPDIWAHEQLPQEIRKFHTTAYGAKFKRSMRQFGTFVTKDKFQNAGIGIQLNYGKDKDSMGLILPNKLLRDMEMDINIAGLDVRLLKIPGETSDQIGLWIPSFQAFMCADDVYRAFPNIYTIRGAPARDPVDWYTSVQRMLDLEPEYLVPSHTQPIIGKENVRGVLEVYRDGIQFVHDQAVRFINKGFSPDDVVKHVVMPEKLRLHPHLREFYGTVPWSVKGVFQLYLGWFSGDPVDLFPLSNTDKASRVVALAGGVSETLNSAIKAWNDNDIQWALELASYILVVDDRNVEARKIKVDCLTLLGIRNINAIASNYYLTSALETSGSVQIKLENKHRQEIITALGPRELFELVSSMYKYDECGGRSDIVVFVIKDLNQQYTIQLRNYVAIVRSDIRPKKYDIKVIASEKALKKMMIEKIVNVQLKDLGDFSLEGNEEKFRSFMACFESDWNK